MFDKAVGKTLLEVAIIIALIAWVLQRAFTSMITTAVIAVIVLSIAAAIVPSGASSKILGKKKR